MKMKYIKTLAVIVILFTLGCDSKDKYDYDAIIPKVLGGVQGPTEAVQTFTATYSTTYFRGGSTWNWSVTDAKIKSISDDTQTAIVQFDVFPADKHATVTVSETTHGGLTSESVSLEVLVKQYCPLPNGVNGLVGNWPGDDAGYESIITAKVSGTKLEMTGFGEGFIADFWGEGVIAQGKVKVTINEDGTVDIPQQYVFTTEYDGDPYRYEIKGSGTWDNCGASPALVIKYDIYYEGESKGLAETYSSYLDNIPYLTATISLSKTKGAFLPAKSKSLSSEFLFLKELRKKNC